ncbi:GntR family transcriptional regulator, partial [Candidatus Bathyarchaeota archaeon]|nr:GntR family transcriptional regulator [Candidatus Bathyarchaeota archaeon]
MEILSNIIEGALFMRGKMISETELSKTLDIPRQPIHEALLTLKAN